MRHPHRRTPLRVGRVAIAAVLGVAALACGGEGEAPAAPVEQTPALPDATGEPGDVAGAWWAVSRELPWCAFRLELEADVDPDAWTGSWTSFDWRGSAGADALARPSLPVAISARREGDALVVTGPAPQFDVSGVPNGERGRWELRVRRVNAPGKEDRYGGVLVHLDHTGPRGVAAVLQRGFEPWSK